MMREALATDIPRLLELLKDGWRRSKYASVGTIDEQVARDKLHYMIIRKGGRGENGTNCKVIEADGRIVGMHFAAKARIKEIGNLLFASDVFFYCSRRAPAFAAMALLDDFFTWASRDPRILEIRPGIDDTIPDETKKRDFHALGELYEKLGFAKVGEVFERRIERSAA